MPIDANQATSRLISPLQRRGDTLHVAEARADPAHLGAGPDGGHLGVGLATHRQGSCAYPACFHIYRDRVAGNGRGFAGEQRFVHMPDRVLEEQIAVGRYAIAFADTDHIVHDQLFGRYALQQTVPAHMSDGAAELTQRAQRAFGAPFLVKR